VVPHLSYTVPSTSWLTNFHLPKWALTKGQLLLSFKFMKSVDKYAANGNCLAPHWSILFYSDRCLNIHNESVC